MELASVKKKLIIHCNNYFSVNISHGPRGTLMCITNESDIQTWRVNAFHESLWRKELNHSKTLDIGQGFYIKVMLIKEVTNGIMESTFAIWRWGNMTSLNVTCEADDYTSTFVLLEAENCSPSNGKTCRIFLTYVHLDNA